MKKVLIIMTILVAPLSYAKAHPWSWAEGCYQTEIRNGSPVKMPDNYAPIAEFKVGESFAMVDINDRQIPSFEMWIMQKYSEAENTIYYDIQSAFTHMGTYTQDANGYHFKYNGPIKLHPAFCQGDCVGNLKVQISLNKISNDLLGLKAVRVVPEAPDQIFDVDDEYVLKKVDCDEASSSRGPQKILKNYFLE